MFFPVVADGLDKISPLDNRNDRSDIAFRVVEITHPLLKQGPFPIVGFNAQDSFASIIDGTTPGIAGQDRPA